MFSKPSLPESVVIFDVWLHFDAANWLFHTCSSRSAQRKYILHFWFSPFMLHM